MGSIGNIFGYVGIGFFALTTAISMGVALIAPDKHEGVFTVWELITAYLIVGIFLNTRRDD